MLLLINFLLLLLHEYVAGVKDLLSITFELRVKRDLGESGCGGGGHLGFLVIERLVPLVLYILVNNSPWRLKRINNLLVYV